MAAAFALVSHRFAVHVGEVLVALHESGTLPGFDVGSGCDTLAHHCTHHSPFTVPHRGLGNLAHIVELVAHLSVLLHFDGEASRSDRTILASDLEGAFSTLVGERHLECHRRLCHLSGEGKTASTHESFPHGTRTEIPIVTLEPQTI